VSFAPLQSRGGSLLRAGVVFRIRKGVKVLFKYSIYYEIKPEHVHKRYHDTGYRVHNIRRRVYRVYNVSYSSISLSTRGMLLRAMQ
jgi:hypothetical protein